MRAAVALWPVWWDGLMGVPQRQPAALNKGTRCDTGAGTDAVCAGPHPSAEGPVIGGGSPRRQGAGGNRNGTCNLVGCPRGCGCASRKTYRRAEHIGHAGQKDSRHCGDGRALPGVSLMPEGGEASPQCRLFIWKACPIRISGHVFLRLSAPSPAGSQRYHVREFLERRCSCVQGKRAFTLSCRVGASWLAR